MEPLSYLLIKILCELYEWLCEHLTNDEIPWSDIVWGMLEVLFCVFCEVFCNTEGVEFLKCLWNEFLAALWDWIISSILSWLWSNGFLGWYFKLKSFLFWLSVLGSLGFWDWLYALLVVPSGIQMHQDFPGQGYRIERIYRGDPIYVFSLLRYYWKNWYVLALELLCYLCADSLSDIWFGWFWIFLHSSVEVLFYDRNLGYEEIPGDIVAVDIYDPVHETSFNVEVNEDTDLNQVINNLNQQYLQTGHVNVNYLGPNTVDNNNNVVPQAPNNNQNNNNVVPPAPNNNQNVQNNANDDIFWSLVTICVAGTVVIISTIIKWGWR